MESGRFIMKKSKDEFFTFDIIMPTYNDSDTIVESLSSIINQGYENYTLYVVDDGSTDDTKNIVNKFKKEYDKNNHIKYFYKENSDQLNAIKYVINYLDGDYVYICHSDDLLNVDVLKNVNIYLHTHREYDSIISNLDIINEDGILTGELKFSNYKNNKNVIPEMILNLGRNFYGDFGFCKRSIFIDKVYKNYLTWNGPFWLDVDNKDILNVKKANFNFFKYRVFEGNYINSDLGRLNVINGELRVLCNLLSKYYIPLFNIQYFIFKSLNKLKLRNIYIPIYLNRETPNKNKTRIIYYTLRKRFSDEEINNNIFLRSLYNFYKNYKVRKITLDKLNDTIYLGSDLRTFNKKILDNSISDFYINILNEMSNGFNEIEIDKSVNIDKVKDLLRFLCINNEVKITRK